MVQPFGKMLILVGAVLLGVGILLTFFDKFPFLGKLPGDIHIKRENFQLYFPITTSVIISVLLSLIFWAISFFNKK
ncbi:MAG: DUF2905 domain-containing protein [Bacteroidota bacterium]